MTTNPYITDLQFALQAKVCVDLTTRDGRKSLHRVHSVDEASGTVSLHDPQTFGDDTTRRRLRIPDIVSLVVTDIE